MGLFRQKFIKLPKAYRQFIDMHLESGGTLLIVDCDLQWPVRRIDDRAVFQFGGVGGASLEEYYHGGLRVAAYLQAFGDSRQKWTPPVADEMTMESEWGFEPRLNSDLYQIAHDAKAKTKRLSFNQPEDLSAFVADFYRDLLTKTGRPADRLLAESFMLLDPHLALRTGSVPFWLVFNAKPSAEVVHRFLDERPGFREISISLFPNGVEAIGQATRMIGSAFSIARANAAICSALTAKSFRPISPVLFATRKQWNGWTPVKHCRSLSPSKQSKTSPLDGQALW